MSLLNKLSFYVCCFIILCTIACRTSYPNVKNTETLPDFPFEMDSLIHYGSIELKKWTEEEMQSADSTQDIKYYRGGVILQALTKLQSSDTIYIPDVTGVPKEKLNTFTRRVPSRENRRLVPMPYQYKTCALDSNTQKRIAYCREINYAYIPINAKTFTHYILNPKYEKDYPDGLPMEMKIYDHTYFDEIISMSWEEWERIGQDSSLYFSEAILPGYYSLTCNNENYDTQCRTMQIQQALRNRGYDIPLSGKMDNMTKATLTRFGKENGLPIPHNGGILTWFPELSELEN